MGEQSVRIKSRREQRPKSVRAAEQRGVPWKHDVVEKVVHGQRVLVKVFRYPLEAADGP